MIQHSITIKCWEVKTHILPLKNGKFGGLSLEMKALILNFEINIIW